jgi:MFS family permease
MLVAGASLMIFAGALFAATRSFWLLLVAATVGVISPSGNEVGPFLAVEQAALSEKTPGDRRTGVFARYNLVGSFATALGALAGGGLAQALQGRGFTPFDAYRVVVVGYAVIGAAMVLLFLGLSSSIEPPRAMRVSDKPAWFEPDLGLRASKRNVFTLAGLFTVDAFAGGFVVQAFVAYWFHRRFGVQPAALGAIFFGANVLAGISALSATWLAQRFGLLRTMVGTHVPSNVLLILVPLMPTLPLAIAMLFARFSISQMDVPTRQAYTMALVTPSERSAAAGITGIARTLGSALSPLIAGPLYASAALAGLPFMLSGGLKIVYDLLVWRTFRKVNLPGLEDSSVKGSARPSRPGGAFEDGRSAR